ncbi:MAG: branched-chain amino acid ABC transporter substrate-binding protein [Candidatus Dormiibacterota bacterium]
MTPPASHSSPAAPAFATRTSATLGALADLDGARVPASPRGGDSDQWAIDTSFAAGLPCRQVRESRSSSTGIRILQGPLGEGGGMRFSASSMARWLALPTCGLLVAACGTTAPPKPIAHGTYSVGVPMPMTGAEAQAGTEIYDGESLAVSEINKAGGVLGHKIVLNEQDDACDPQTAVNAANDLVSAGVQAIVGNYCSSAAQPSEPIFARANGGNGIPNIQPSANSSTLTQAGFHNVFLIDPSGSQQATEAAAFFTKILKVKSLLIADDQSTYAVNVAQLTAQDLRGSGVQTFPIQAVPDTTQDFSSVITTISSDHAQAVYWTGYFAQAAEFVRQLRAAGSNIPFVTADGSVDPSFISDGGSAASGTYATIAVITQYLSGPAAKKFDQNYTAAYHSQPGPYSAYGYDGIYALANAAKKANSLDPVKVIAALHSLKFTGLTGPVSFAADGARQGAHFIVLEVVNGQYQLAPHQP